MYFPASPTPVLASGGRRVSFTHDFRSGASAWEGERGLERDSRPTPAT